MVIVTVEQQDDLKFHQVQLSPVLLEKLGWFRGDIIELENAPKRHRAIITEHLDRNAGKFVMRACEEFCLNAGIWFNDQVSIGKIECQDRVPLSFIEIATFASEDDRDNELQIITEFFAELYFVPLNKGQTIKIPVFGDSMVIKIVDCSEEYGYFLHQSTEIKLSQHQVVVSNTKSANK